MKRSVRTLFVVALLAASASAADKTKSQEAFDRLASLQGAWKAWLTASTPL
jgi:hypothetical protein